MKLCVVIPACNEEATLEPLAEGIASALADHDYRILFIDDGSTDGSYAAMLRSREKNPRIDVVKFARNCGKTRALAVASRARSPILPDVPTMIESGLPGYETATNYTLYAPARTPAEVVALLNRETNAVLKMPEVVEKLTAMGIVVTGGSTEAAVARTAAETVKWAGVIRKGNLQLS